LSYALDTNVLVYASDRASRWHEPAVSFLTSCIENTEILYLAWPVLMGYLRIVTHPSIFESPLTPAEAEGNVAELLARSQVRMLGEVDKLWATYQSLSAQVTVRGNLVPDAHLAAILLASGVRTIYTRDRDFLKFAGLVVRDPFA